MHVSRILPSSRAITLTTALAITLCFAGCKKATPPPPPNDAALNSAVQNRISGDSALQSEPIQVSVQDGVATLNGTVSNEAARSLAASDAAQVAGLNTVINNLTVQQSTQQPAPQPATVMAPLPSRVHKIEKEPVKKKIHPEPIEHSPAPIERVPPVQQAQSTPPPPPPPPPAPVPAAPTFRNITVPAGATLPIRITQTLDSATTQQGDSFSGTVASDVVIDGTIVIPHGTAVSGRVDAVQEAAHFKGNSLLTIELTSLRRHGDEVALSTDPYSVKGKGRGKNTAIKTGGGAAVGAILGGLFGGGRGAAIGAAAGGGVGAGSNAITRGEQVQIPSESLVRFHLSNSILLRVSNKPQSTPDQPDLQQRSGNQQQQ